MNTRKRVSIRASHEIRLEKVGLSFEPPNLRRAMQIKLPEHGQSLEMGIVACCMQTAYIYYDRADRQNAKMCKFGLRQCKAKIQERYTCRLRIKGLKEYPMLIFGHQIMPIK